MMETTMAVPLVQHRPFGSDHPYVPSNDQLVPSPPEAGAPLRISAVVHGVQTLECELEWDDGEQRRLSMVPSSLDAGGAAALVGGEGHLADAQAEALASEGGWTTVLDAARPGRGRYRFVADGTPATDWFDLAPAAWTDEPVGSLTGVGPRLVPGSVSWLASAVGVHRVRFALALRPTEHVVGFGERFDAVDQRGRRPDSVVFEQYKAQGRHGRTYLPMPFAHVIGEDGAAWGFHVRTSRRVWFDVGATDPSRLWIEVDLGTGAPALDVGVWDGSPADVLTAFLDEVGRAEELPPWVLRLWASGNEWNTQAAVEQQVARHREAGIPLGVVVVEAWSDEEGFSVFRDASYTPHLDGTPHRASDFTYPADAAWPDPVGMTAALHDQGVRLVLWQIPLQTTDASVGAEAAADARLLAERGYAVAEADGSPYLNRGWWFPRALMPDFTSPEARAWWLEKRRWLVRDVGVDGFKTDGGEHAWGRDLRYADGRRGDDGNNRYPVEYAKAFGDLLRSEGRPPVTFSRAGYTGSQAHGAFWAGDEDSTWEAFRHSLTAGLTAASCGIVYWGWDIAGFSGPVPDPELYLRAVAASTFLPIMQYHSEFNHHLRPSRDRTPWNVAEQAGDRTVVDVFRRYAQLRERLQDYLTDAARTAVTTDRPLLRPLFFDWPDDPTIWAHPGEFMAGDALLVHPVTEPGITSWNTYLPVGDWIDVWTGTTYKGARQVSKDLTRDDIPVYCRASHWAALAGVFADSGTIG